MTLRDPLDGRCITRLELLGLQKKPRSRRCRGSFSSLRNNLGLRTDASGSKRSSRKVVAADVTGPRLTFLCVYFLNNKTASVPKQKQLICAVTWWGSTIGVQQPGNWISFRDKHPAGFYIDVFPNLVCIPHCFPVTRLNKALTG